MPWAFFVPLICVCIVFGPAGLFCVHCGLIGAGRESRERDLLAGVAKTSEVIVVALGGADASFCCSVFWVLKVGGRERERDLSSLVQ